MPLVAFALSNQILKIDWTIEAIIALDEVCPDVGIKSIQIFCQKLTK